MTREEPTIDQLAVLIQKTLVSLSLTSNKKMRKEKLEKLDFLQKMYDKKITEMFGVEPIIGEENE